MKALRVLHMRNTCRTLDNIPPILDDLDNLQDVDFSSNELPQVPDCVYKLKSLRKLDLSHNQIERIELDEKGWEQLETLNISSNLLKSLPEQIVRLVKLQRLYASDNQLTFDGIPSGIGKLVHLQVLHLSYNKLELIPEGISRCVRLERLKLDNNKLITLPDSIHLLPDLKQLDLHNNDELVMPPKPNEQRKALAFYNIDFSLANQMKLAGQSPSSSISSVPSSGPHKDPVARKKEFLKRRRMQADSQGANKVIEGMSNVAGAARERLENENTTALGHHEDGVKIPSWKVIVRHTSININTSYVIVVMKFSSYLKDKIEQRKPRIDYSDVFDEEVGQNAGLWLWQIENFYPTILDESFYGHFYEADAYLILRTIKEESGALKHSIYYWIGEHASLDKGMCAAVHAVNLRNYLGATCRTEREDMNEESDEFLELFGEEITYIEGARTASGFYKIEKQPHINRLYRVSANGSSVQMEPVPVSVDSLDPRYVFFLDAGDTMWIWSGRKARITISNKARLFAVKMNKKDRKGTSEIETCTELKTPEEFWIALCGQPKKPDDPIVEHVDADFVPERRRLYQVQIGMGFLELPQVDLKGGVLKQDMLSTKCAYILDCTSDIFLWLGKKANRLLKMAGQKMVCELHAMLERPDYTTISREVEGEETTMFRSKFQGWDDIVPYDFTMTADSVQRRGADLKVIMERDKIKTDLASLFLPRQPPMSEDEADQMMEECNEDLEYLEPFVLRIVEKRQEDFKCVVYFWQGRDANNMGWLHFTFSLQKKFEDLFKDKLEVVRMYQQQENHKFLSHFHRKFVIRRGRRGLTMNLGVTVMTNVLNIQKKFEDLFKDKLEVKKFEDLFKDKLEVVRMYQQQENHKFLSHFHRKFVIRRGRRGLTMNLGGHWPELFAMRANGSSVCTRTIQIDCKATHLNSSFCFILRAPYRCVDDDGCKGKIFVWMGKHTTKKQHSLCEEIARELINRDNEFPIELVNEGEESDVFWEYIGGKKKYDTNGDFLMYARLFRCTNEKGYFAVSEKTVDFCQDDLDDDDTMILDNGEQVFLWMGAHASEVELKLAYKAAQVYLAHMKIKQPDRPRRLMLSIKGRESRRFTKCFHAWGKHKVPAGDQL
ncbi:unnamed protein product [Anisakis simplex]|uniref:Putative flightless-I (inferred by orthology to a S. mansoni protein) n=1 Tax=Anisakis simplex TaxID=6269 RepID=A0A0M3K3D3_ANISI|nr:unnamed protein product [Anisakis simplex]